MVRSNGERKKRRAWRMNSRKVARKGKWRDGEMHRDPLLIRRRHSKTDFCPLNDFPAEVGADVALRVLWSCCPLGLSLSRWNCLSAISSNLLVDKLPKNHSEILSFAQSWLLINIWHRSQSLQNDLWSGCSPSLWASLPLLDQMFLGGQKPPGLRKNIVECQPSTCRAHHSF